MGKGRSKNKVKRSTATLPKGIPNKKRGGSSTNAFEYAKSINSSTRVKHHVHNRIIPGQQRPSSSSNNNNSNSKQYQSSLSKSISLRKSHLSTQLQRQTKSNKFIDRRIGEATNRNNYDGPTKNDVMLKRIVQERLRRSNKRAKFSLQDDNEDDSYDGQLLTHGGKAIDYTSKTIDDVLLSDDSDDDLDKVDTMLHFGGGKFDTDNHQEQSAYGPSSGGTDMGDVYRSRKEQLEERIRHKKQLKLEKLKRKENQVDTFDNMDKSFDELAQLLSFRDKESERKERFERKKEGKLSQVEVEMDDWDKEMKEYLFERKVRATDRTKTPEKIAQEESKRLHALESKRLARMDGDILSDDELSDISDDDGQDDNDSKERRRRRDRRRKDGEKIVKKKKRQGTNPEEMSDSDDDDDKKGKEEHGVQFTADGLMYVDKHGNFVGKVGEEEENDSKSEDKEDSDDSDSESSNDDKSDQHDLGGSDDEASAASYDSEDDDDSEEEDSPAVELKKGVSIQGNYHASEQYGNKVTWYNGTITDIREENGTKVYDVTYDDGDFEEGMTAENVRPLPKSKEEKRKEQIKKNEVDVAKKKKLKAKMRAKEAIPFVFEVPTTLDGLHDLIAQYASTGADASLIIQRIHATNSVRLNYKNKEKIQNYYDVLLKRFVAVGDAIFTSGNGGPDLERYEQLNSLTQTLYAMSQDSPESAGAVWSRRLGIFQKALSKRLRDVEVTPLGDACDDEFTAWPSTGMLLLMRALPHIFPSTDRRHAVVTPALLLLGQILAQTPIKSRYDLVMGLFTTGLMLEYTKGAKRLAPEATAFLAGALRLFSDDVEATVGDGPLPSLANISKCPQLLQLRQDVSRSSTNSAVTDKVRLSLEKDDIQSDTNPLAILTSTLKLTQQAFTIIGKSRDGSEREIFSEVLKSLLYITGKRKDCPLPSSVKSILAETARTAASTCASDDLRQPLQRRKSASVKDLAIKTLAPRMEDPTKYSMSKDKGKSQLQAEHDRHRREYKREHKAAMRELRLDSAFIESERRKAKTKTDDKAREKRHKNFAWLEAEQGLLNQQVRMGGGLLQGGGTGAARRAAKSGKLGIKKGGKMS